MAVASSNRMRLTAWFVFIGSVAALEYSQYGRTPASDAIYKYSTFAGGLVQYGFFLLVVVLIAIDRFDLFALERPPSWRRATLLIGALLLLIYAWEGIVVRLPIEDPGKEQGLTPTRWEPHFAAPFVLNFVLFVVVGPVVEELMFRGVGQSLLRMFGRVPSIVLVAAAFGIYHGLLVALLVIVPLGGGLAYLRERTGSVYPGMVAHGCFNAIAIGLSFV